MVAKTVVTKKDWFKWVMMLLIIVLVIGWAIYERSERKEAEKNSKVPSVAPAPIAGNTASGILQEKEITTTTETKIVPVGQPKSKPKETPKKIPLQKALLERVNDSRQTKPLIESFIPKKQNTASRDRPSLLEGVDTSIPIEAPKSVRKVIVHDSPRDVYVRQSRYSDRGYGRYYSGERSSYGSGNYVNPQPATFTSPQPVYHKKVRPPQEVSARMTGDTGGAGNGLQ